MNKKLKIIYLKKTLLILSVFFALLNISTFSYADTNSEIGKKIEKGEMLDNVNLTDITLTTKESENKEINTQDNMQDDLKDSVSYAENERIHNDEIVANASQSLGGKGYGSVKVKSKLPITGDSIMPMCLLGVMLILSMVMILIIKKIKKKYKGDYR